MKVVALVSGGKDSVFSIFHCMANGHDVVALANLHPQPGASDELDSYMFQTVGHDAIPHLASCIVNPAHEDQSTAPDIPLFRRVTRGKSISRELRYDSAPGSEDEVEDLYALLQDVKASVPQVQAVCSGAILSTYQRLRVENVCQRLGLQSLAYLWNADQSLLLDSIVKAKMECVLVKVATIGLQECHLGKTLGELQPHLESMSKKYGINVCGEGGEYETLTLDAPFFRRRMYLDSTRLVIVQADPHAPTAYLALEKIQCVPKSLESMQYSKIKAAIADMKVYPASKFNLTVSEKSQVTLNPKLVGSTLASSATDGKCSTPMLRISNGNFYVTGISSTNVDANDGGITRQAEEVMTALRNTLEKNHFTYENLVFVHVYVKNMSDFAALNAVYGKFFGFGPAARACVEANIDTAIQIDALGVTDKSTRRALHVQSVSYWAPANIGPYSQCVTVSNCASFIAGQIGFTPESMTLPSDMITQAVLALRHVHRVAREQQSRRLDYEPEEKYISCICYATDLNASAQSQLKGLYTRPMILVQVPSLPRNALVEWMIVASDDPSDEKAASRKIDFSGVKNNLCAIGWHMRCGNVASAIVHFNVAECHSRDEMAQCLSDITSKMGPGDEYAAISSRLFYLKSLGDGFEKLVNNVMQSCATVPCSLLGDDAHVAIVTHYSKLRASEN